MKKYSVAIFGSSQRANFDKYSDKDLLIVAETYKTTNKLRIGYEEAGYSVSTYTYNKLQYLSRLGSLFVQHLKKESSILIDYDDRLKHLLSEHKESIPTSRQISESSEYFNLLKNVPDTSIGYAWFCDCFYVGLRNYLILKSAAQSDYNFSFLTLVNGLLESNTISKSDFEVLRQLRVLKKNYRERIIDELPTRQFIISLIDIGKKLNLTHSISFSSYENFQLHVKREIKRNHVDHYFKLRYIEIYYLLSGKINIELDKIIRNPQFYALKFKNYNFISKLISEIDKKPVLQNSRHKRSFTSI